MQECACFAIQEEGVENITKEYTDLARLPVVFIWDHGEDMKDFTLNQLMYGGEDPFSTNKEAKREYQQEISRVWGKEIASAEMMVKESSSFADEEYKVTLDPEDFLDLCAGKWHTVRK